MMPYELDPSLHATEPLQPQLDDGFSPPAVDDTQMLPPGQPVDPALWTKSLF